MGKDYLESFKPSESEPSELKHYGIKGMKWGRRRSDSQLRAARGETKPDGSERRQVVGAASGETSATRYARLASQAKRGGASEFSEQDLKFFNSRTEALNKVSKMYETKPGWLQSTARKVIQNTAEKQMQNVSDALGNKYVGGPLIGAIKGGIAEGKSKAEESKKAAATAPKEAPKESSKPKSGFAPDPKAYTGTPSETSTPKPRKVYSEQNPDGAYNVTSLPEISSTPVRELPPGKDYL